MLQSLNLDDDDASDALDALERSLGFEFRPDELAECRTVGDIERMAAARVMQASGEGCASAIAFYRLRRALTPYAGGERLRPSHVLSAVIEHERPGRLMKEIEAETRLHLPPAASSRLGIVAFATAALSLLAILPVHSFYPGWTLLPILAVPASIWAIAVDPGRFPADCRTLADLARKTALLSYGHLLEAGARPTRADLWQVITEILSSYSTVPKAAITPHMLILPEERYAA